MFICDHKHFAGSCDYVNPYCAGYQLLGKGDIDVARSYNDIHLGNRLCTICKGRDSPGASSLVDGFNTYPVGGHKQMRVDLSVSCWGCGDA